MVGRDCELERLSAMATPAGSTRVAMIAGEPGIGKTRLVRELLQHLPVDVQVLTAQADPRAPDRPGALVDQLAPDVGTGEAAGRAGDRFDAAAGRVWNAVGGRPALLVFEDLHWADPDSIAVFEWLAEPGDVPLSIVGTYRPEELDQHHPLAAALHRMQRRHSMTELHLDRLARRDVMAFLTSIYGSEAPVIEAIALHRRTGGNPFFLEEIVKAAGDAAPGSLDEQPLPWSLSEALRSQLEGLSARDRGVAEAAAVLGRRVSFDLLARVAGHDESTLIEALRELVDKGLLVESNPDVFEFRHALTCEAVAEQLLSRQRRRWHQLAWDALTAEAPHATSDPAQLAIHAHGAGRLDDMIDAARQGAQREMAHGAPFKALWLARFGLQEAGDDTGLLAVAARASALLDLLDEAERHTAAWLAATDDPEDRLRALLFSMRLAWDDWEPEVLQQRFDEVRAVADTLPDGENRARAVVALAQIEMLRGRLDAAERLADEAEQMAERFDLPAVHVAAQVEKGSALSRTEAHYAQGRDILLDAAVRAEGIGEHLLTARAVKNTGSSLFETGSQAQQRDMLDRMFAAASRIGAYKFIVDGYYRGLVRMQVQAGDLDAALQLLEECRARYPHASRMPKHLAHHAEMLLERDDGAAAAALRAEMPRQGRFSAFECAVLDCQFALRSADLDRARAELTKLLLLRKQLPYVFFGPSVHGLVAQGLRHGMSSVELQPLAEHVDDSGKPFDDVVSWRSWHELVGAQLDEADGDWPRAAQRYAAAAVDDRLLRPYRGTAHVGAARCFTALGRRDNAAEHVEAAQVCLARWGGWRRVELDEAAAVLQPRQANGALTPREIEVSELLAEGLTNAEVAQRLTISKKTAAVHVSNILGKLGMSSRTQVAAWASRKQAVDG